MGNKIEMEITDLVEKNSTLLRLGLHLEFNDARHRVAAHLQRNIDRSEYWTESYYFILEPFFSRKNWLEFTIAWSDKFVFQARLPRNLYESVERRLLIKLITETFPTTKNNSDEATDVITGVGGKTYLVIKHPCTKIATIIDKTTNEKEFVIAKEFHAKPIILDDGRQWDDTLFSLIIISPPR